MAAVTQLDPDRWKWHWKNLTRDQRDDLLHFTEAFLFEQSCQEASHLALISALCMRDIPRKAWAREKRRERIPHDYIEDLTTPPSVLPDLTLDHEDEIEFILSDLTVSEREAIETYARQALSIKAAAQELAISGALLKKRLLRGRKKLRMPLDVE